MKTKSTTDFKAIKAALKLDGTIFNINGIYNTEKNEAGEHIRVPQRFKTSMHLMSVGEPTPVHSFSKDHWLADSMNVKKFGSTRVSLYTFTPFGKQVKQTIFYKNITIISIKPTESEPVTQPSDNQQVKTA